MSQMEMKTKIRETSIYLAHAICKAMEKKKNKGSNENV